MKAKVWILKERPKTKPSLQNFACIEQELTKCQDGDILIETEWLTVDPYIRYKIDEMPLNDVIHCAQVAKVIESKNPDFPVGIYGITHAGWRTHSLLKKDELGDLDTFRKLPDFGNLPRSLGLGILGMPGLTAYFGFLEVCLPKENETVLVNGAAGAVGSAVCQIAKIKGCKVIAFAGSHKKVNWLKELGVDHAFNYKTVKVSEALANAAPSGIDCYFDNVGGDFTAEVIPHMATHGRISICGAISDYNVAGALTTSRVERNGPISTIALNIKELTVKGFMVKSYYSKYYEGINTLKKWIEEGKLKYKETIAKGFDKMPEAFIGLFDGENIGKSIVSAK